MPVTRANDDLFHALASRVRATSDGALVLAVLAGLTTAIVLAVWRPPAWTILGSLGVCAAAIGAWGIADRELAERAGIGRRVSVSVLRAFRSLAVLVGIAAAAVAAFRVFGAVLGTWIS